MPRSPELLRPDQRERFHDWLLERREWSERLMRARLRTSPDLEVERPEPLADSARVPWNFTHHSFTFLRRFDVSPDGTSFVTTKMPPAPEQLHLVTNWFAELRELAPGDSR